MSLLMRVTPAVRGSAMAMRLGLHMRSLHNVTEAATAATVCQPPLSVSVAHHHSLTQRRTMFIQTRDTPNPNSLIFYPGSEVTGGPTFDFTSLEQAHQQSPLARRLFGVEGVSGVFLGADFVTVSKEEGATWDVLRPHVFGTIMDFYSSGQPVLKDAAEATADAGGEEDDEIVLMIKELLDTRIRPAVQEDGGDIHYMGFEDGVVELKLSGACKTCPSSLFTLHQGVESMLMHYIPEVMGVKQVEEDDDELAKVSNEAFAKLEESVNTSNKTKNGE